VGSSGRPWRTCFHSRRNCLPMPPRDEMNIFLMTVSEAVDLAREGNAGDGHSALLAGLHRAEQARDGGATWGEELVRCYQNTLARFGKMYRIDR
jgi:hypothetical protein